MSISYRMIVAVCLTGTALTLPAFAEVIPPAAKVILDNIERQANVKPTYDSIETDGSGTVTISNLKLSKAGVDGAPGVTTSIEEISLGEISDEGDGLYEIGSASFSGVKGDVSSPGFALSFDVPEIEAEDLYVKALGPDATPEEQFRASMTVAHKTSAGKMSITTVGQTFTIDGYETTWDGDPQSGSGKFTMKISNIAVPESAIAMADQMGMLKQLGYAGLNFDLTSAGQMDVKDGNLGMDMNFSISGKDIGTINIAGAASDVPVAVYAVLQNAQKSGKEPDFTAMLPQLQAVTFKSAALRFEDSSLTKRLLPMLAKMQGMDEATLIASAGAMMQMGLMQLQNQAFSEQATAAVNGFLKDPKSITISVKPASPIKVQDLMSLNPAAPGETITKLGVSVSAND